MYTYNIFVFGHDLSVNKELNNNLTEFDIQFAHTVNGINYKIHAPYHGGQCPGDTYSVVFGATITDSDDNKEYVNEVRNAKKEDYIDGYNEFLREFIRDLEENKGVDHDYDMFADELITFLNNNEPGFYSVEASS